MNCVILRNLRMGHGSIYWDKTEGSVAKFYKFRYFVPFLYDFMNSKTLIL